MTRTSHGLILGTAFAAAMVAGAALAADPSSGFYVGGGLGGSRFDQDFGSAVRGAYAASPFTVTSAGMTDKTGTTGIVYAGWQFHRYGAVEAAYAYLGKAKAAYALERNGAFTRDAEYEASAVTLALVGTLPLGSNVTLLAKGGVAFTMLDYAERGSDRGQPHAFDAGREDQTRGMAGLGASYAFTPNWSVRGEWNRYFDIGEPFALNATGNGRFDAIDAFWLGVQYRF